MNQFPNIRRYPSQGPQQRGKLHEQLYEYVLQVTGSEEAAQASLANIQAMRSMGLYKPSEVVLVSGGTIVSIHTDDGIEPGAPLEALLNSESDIYYQICESTGEFAKSFYGDEGSKFDFGEMFDSTDARFEHVIRLIDIIERYLEDPEINRMVILCGTDTYGYIVAALSQMVHFPTARIVVTCSMLPPGVEGSDAGPNVHRARYIADCMARDDQGFVGAFGDRVFDPRRISKVHSTSMTPFESPGTLDIGSLVVDRDDITRPFRWLENRTVPPLAECHYVASALLYAKQQKFLAWTTDKLPPHVAHVYRNTPDEEILRVILQEFPGVKEYIARGGEIDVDDIVRDRTTEVDRRYENSSLWEELNDQYNPDWLENLLSNPNLHGLIVSGIETLSAEKHSKIVSIIEKFSAQKPIIIFQDPSAIETPEERNLQEAAISAGAFYSNRMTIEWSTVLLKRLLAQSHDPEKIKVLWQSGEKIGTPLPIRALKKRTDLDPKPQIGPLNHHIRVVNINFDHPPDFLEAALMRDDIDGVIVRGFGPGNLPAHLVEVMERVSAIKPCVIASLIEGPQNNDYTTGNRAIKIGMLPAGELGYEGTAQRLDRILSITKDLAEVKKLWSDPPI